MRAIAPMSSGNYYPMCLVAQHGIDTTKPVNLTFCVHFTRRVVHIPQSEITFHYVHDKHVLNIEQ